MSLETNKAIVRRGFEEGLNRQNFGVFDELLAPNFVNHDLPAPGPGPEGFKEVARMFVTGFPDMRITIEDIVAEGDRVVTRGYFTGTHRGEFMQLPATGRSVKAKYLDMWRVVDGKCVDNWVQIDMLGLMQQLGLAAAAG